MDQKNRYLEEFSRMYVDATRVQSAVNLAGVTLSFYQIVLAARAETGQGQVNKHPAVRAFFFKILDLMGDPSTKDMVDAVIFCENETDRLTARQTQKLTPE